MRNCLVLVGFSLDSRWWLVLIVDGKLVHQIVQLVLYHAHSHTHSVRSCRVGGAGGACGACGARQ